MWIEEWSDFIHIHNHLQIKHTSTTATRWCY